MNDLDNLIEYLRLDRRRDEAMEDPAEGVNLHLNYLEDNGDAGQITQDELLNEAIYKDLYGVLQYYNAGHIYLWGTGTDSNYYIKTGTGTYLNLDNYNIQTLSAEELQEFPITFGNGYYYYHKVQDRVLYASPDLEEIFVFGDVIEFDPEAEYIKDIRSRKYDYKFRTHKLRFSKEGMEERPDLDFDEVLVFKNTLKAEINLIPVMEATTAFGYRLWYLYQQPGYRPSSFMIRDTDCAVKLEFGSIGGFLAFLDATLFSQGFDISQTGNDMVRDTFRDSFYDDILKGLKNMLGSIGTMNYMDAMKLLYYLPPSVADEIGLGTWWELAKALIKKGDIKTSAMLKEEFIFMKLLEMLLEGEDPEENKHWQKEFIKALAGLTDKKELALEYLYKELDAQDHKKFIKMVNAAWRVSLFTDPYSTLYESSDGPFALPYRSKENWLGFYVTNAKVSFAANEGQQMIYVGLKTGEKVMVPSQSRTGLKEVDILESFWYHPFHPVYLVNIEQQETETKLDAIVPAFMLLVNEDKQFWSNVMTGGAYALDVVTTLSGIGNIAKFRYLSRLVRLTEGVEALDKTRKALNILRYVKRAVGVVEITSGSVNLMLKLTGARDTEFGQSLSEVLFWIELTVLAGDLTTSMVVGLRKSAKKAIESSDVALRAKHPELFAELYRMAGLRNIYQHADEFLHTRPKFHNMDLVNQLWEKKIVKKLLFPKELRALYTKYLKEFPGLQKGFNQAEFRTVIMNQGRKVDEVVEFSISGDKSKLSTYFGKPPKLPENTIDVLNDYENFEAFVKGASDFSKQSRKYDSEIKYIFNFLKNHIDKGDEFIIETRNIFRTCGSCRREFVMLEDYLKLQGKKVKITVISDDVIEGTRALKDKLKIK